MKYVPTQWSVASGSVAGCTYSRNRFGAYIRQRAVPVNPASDFQSVVRSNFASLQQAWVSTLSDVQRSGWDSYALGVAKTKLGQVYHALGINWYAAVNSLRLLAGLARIDNAPIPQTGTALTPPTIADIDAALDEVTADLTDTDEWATTAGGLLFVFASRPMNATRNNLQVPYRFITTIAGVATPPGPAPNSTGALAAPFPFSVGQRVAMRFVAMAADGRLSTPQSISGIAT